MSVSRRLRFEILRRDGHACRYCGATAPDVRLSVDHVIPVALGGSDEPSNLVTACVDCNSGKSAAAPDAAHVEDVAALALRYARAIEMAQRAAADRVRAEEEFVSDFVDLWAEWAIPRYRYAKVPNYRAACPGDDEGDMPLPDGFEDSVATFRRLGLDVTTMRRFVDRAMRKPGVRHQDRFRYFCGIAWAHIRDTQAAAIEMLEVE